MVKGHRGGVFDSDSSSGSAEWRDRSALLRALGFGLLLGGWGILALGPALAVSGREGAADAVEALAQLLPLGVTLLVCGTGLWRLKRWARQAVTAVSFVFLAKGVLFCLQFVRQLPLMIEELARSENPPPPGIIESLQGVSVLMAALVYLGLPGLYLWVVSGRNAAATLAARQESPSRLDGVPGPVLALAFLFAWEGTGLLTMLVFNATVPFFGLVFSGAQGAGILTGGALLALYCARLLLERSRAGWLLAAGLLAAVCLSWAATHHAAGDPGFYKGLYERMGFEAEEVRLLVATESGPWNARWTLAGAVAALAFCLWLERYFRAGRKAGEGAAE